MRGRITWGAAIAAALSLLATASDARAQMIVRPDNSVRNLAVPAPNRLSPVPASAAKEGRFAKNDVVFSYRLDNPPAAHLSGTLAVTGAGKSFIFAAGQEFVLSVADSRMADRISRGSRIFCGEAKANMTAILLSSFLSKYGRETRPCLVDTDNDMRFDQFFLSGTKHEEDSVLVAIQPTAYSVRERYGTTGDHVDFVFRGFTGSGKMKLGVRRYVEGKREDYLTLILGHNLASFQQFAGDILQAADSGGNGIPPYEARFFGTPVRVASIDPDKQSFSGTATPPHQALWAYFVTRGDTYVPATH